MRKTETMNADAHLNLDALNHSELKKAMGCFVTGIAVVTTRYRGGDFGMTCNSFNTVSLDPPMVLWSVSRSTASHDAFANGDGYTISILGADQVEVAHRFTRGTPEERFAGLPVTRLVSGRTVIDGSVAYFDCAMDKVVEAGDHDVLIGRVLTFSSNRKAPLAYLRGQFMDIAG